MTQTKIAFENKETLARKGDVDTSHLAAKEITKSGRRASLKQMIYDWMLDNGITTPEAALTPHELAARSGLDHPACHKRLPDLRADGFTETTHTRLCRITGRPSWVWRARMPEERVSDKAR